MTLIEPKEYFEYTPGILHLLTGSLSNNIILSQLNQVSGGAKIINGFFQGLKIKNREVIVKKLRHNENSDSNSDSVMKVPYDYVIIATGRPYTSPIRPPSTTFTLSQRNEIIKTFLNKINSSNNIVVSGGGLVGVELVAELAHRWKGKDKKINDKNDGDKIKKTISLITKSSLLSTLPSSAGQIAQTWLESNEVKLYLQDEITSFEEIESNSNVNSNINSIAKSNMVITTKNGKTIHSDCFVDCTGGIYQVPNSISTSSATSEIISKIKSSSNKNVMSPYNEKGYVVVDEMLRSVQFPDVFAAGDVIQHAPDHLIRLGHAAGDRWSFGDKFQLPPVRNAHLAESQAEAVAKTILALSSSASSSTQMNAHAYTPYPRSVFGSNYTPALACVSLGPNNGIVIFNDLVVGGVIFGIIGAFVKFFIERSKISEIRQERTGRLIWAMGHVISNFFHQISVFINEIFLRNKSKHREKTFVIQ